MNARAALVVLAALTLSWALARWVRRRASRTPAGQRFLGHPAAVPAVGVLAFFATISVAAPLATVYGPNLPLDILNLKNRPPSFAHPLGTDALSRDLWSRVVFGSQPSLTIGALSALLAVTVGAAVGAVAGTPAAGWMRFSCVASMSDSPCRASSS